MPCKHGENSTPSSCSQCLGARVRTITLVAGKLRVNGRQWKLRPFAIPEVKMMYTRGRRKRAFTAAPAVVKAEYQSCDEASS